MQVHGSHDILLKLQNSRLFGWFLKAIAAWETSKSGGSFDWLLRSCNNLGLDLTKLVWVSCELIL